MKIILISVLTLVVICYIIYKLVNRIKRGEVYVHGEYYIYYFEKKDNKWICKISKKTLPKLIIWEVDLDVLLVPGVDWNTADPKDLNFLVFIWINNLLTKLNKK